MASMPVQATVSIFAFSISPTVIMAGGSGAVNAPGLSERRFSSGFIFSSRRSGINKIFTDTYLIILFFSAIILPLKTFRVKTVS